MSENARALLLMAMFFGWIYFDMFHRHDPRDN